MDDFRYLGGCAVSPKGTLCSVIGVVLQKADNVPRYDKRNDS